MCKWIALWQRSRKLCTTTSEALKEARLIINKSEQKLTICSPSIVGEGSHNTDGIFPSLYNAISNNNLKPQIPYIYQVQMLLLLSVVETSNTLQETNNIGQGSEREEYSKIVSLDTAFVPRIAEVRPVRASNEIQVREAEY